MKEAKSSGKFNRKKLGRGEGNEHEGTKLDHELDAPSWGQLSTTSRKQDRKMRLKLIQTHCVEERKTEKKKKNGPVGSFGRKGNHLVVTTSPTEERASKGREKVEERKTAG